MWRHLLAVGLALVACGAQAKALDISPDVTIELGAAPGGATVHQQDVARDILSGGAPGTIADLGPLPDGADVVGYHESSPTQQFFVLDSSADLGGTHASAGDVIAYDPGTGVYQIELDISAAGVPDGTRVDAFGLASNGDYILSFDITVDLGGGLVASDEDLINYSLGIVGGFTMLLNGSNVGLDRSLDLDAASELNGNLLVSFDSDGSIGGIDFADEDILSFDLANNAWTSEYDGSAVHPGQWVGADLVAVPEPGAWSLMGAGMALLAGLARRKRKLALLAALLVPASTGMASDGVLEINHACAVNTGCFSGDTAGLPVTITSAGSYMLTSNLTQSTANTNVIDVAANDVSIDLNGFSILGGVTCSSSGSSSAGFTTACTGTGAGTGISGPYDRMRITNGIVKGMGSHGIQTGSRAFVSDVIISNVGGTALRSQLGSIIRSVQINLAGDQGISTNAGSVIENSLVSQCNSDGIYTASGRSMVRNSMIHNNGGWGINAATTSARILDSSLSYNRSGGIKARITTLVRGCTLNQNIGPGLDGPSTGNAYYGDNIIADNGSTLIGNWVAIGSSNICDGNTTCP